MTNFTKQEILIGGGSILAAISSFLPWYTISFWGVKQSISGFTGWWTLSFLAALALIASLFPQAKKAVPQIEENIKVIHMALAAVITLVPLIALISQPSEMLGMGNVNIGLFTALAGGIAALAGGIIQNRQNNQPIDTPTPPVNESASSE